MLRAFRIPLTWTELLARTANHAISDNVLGMAAQLAYYFLLALVPGIVFVVALTSFFPVRLIDSMLTTLAAVAPDAVFAIVRDQIQALRGGEHGGVLTVGLLVALWSSSAALASITNALNKAYGIEEGRPWWKVRLIAIGLTVGLTVFLLAAFTLTMVGPAMADSLASRIGLGDAFALTWKVAQWPVVFVLIVVALALLNYFAPDAEQDWTWVTPGAVLAAVLWVGATLGFKYYVANVADYNATYGSLGGVIVLMLWFYISGVAILAGAGMNAEIELASPHSQASARTPGRKKKLGEAARRDWEQRRRRAIS